MSKKQIFAVEGEPDVVLEIDDTGRNFRIYGDDPTDTAEGSVEEGKEQQTADIFQALADHTGALVPDRPSSFVREWAKVAPEFASLAAVSEIPDALIEAADLVRQAARDGDEEELAACIPSMIVLLMAFDHHKGLRSAARLEKLAELQRKTPE